MEYKLNLDLHSHNGGTSNEKNTVYMFIFHYPT